MATVAPARQSQQHSSTMNAIVLFVAALVAVAAARPQGVQQQSYLLRSAVPQYQQQSVVFKNGPVFQEQPASFHRSVQHEFHTSQVQQPVYTKKVSTVSQVSPFGVLDTRSPFGHHQQLSPVEPIKILNEVHEFDPSGFYRSNFETENGIVYVEQGSVKDLNLKDGPVAAKEGSYAYTGPDGVQYTVNWIADENGFRASGAHLPVAPEVPAAIQRSLDLIASQPDQYDDEGKPIVLAKSFEQEIRTVPVAEQQ